MVREVGRLCSVALPSILRKRFDDGLHVLQAHGRLVEPERGLHWSLSLQSSE
jgi:hypothetical protein